MSRYLVRGVAVALSALFAVVAFSYIEARSEPSGKVGTNQIAEAMAKALKAYHPGEPLGAFMVDVPEDQKPILQSFTTALLDGYGSDYSGQAKLQFIMSVRTWFLSRSLKPGHPDPAQYEARLRVLRPQMFDDWTVENKRLALSLTDKPLLALALIFHERLWRGGGLNEVGASSMLARLKSLPDSVVRDWAEASRTTQVPFIAAYSMTSVDALFVKDALITERFQAALPRAGALVTGN